MTKLLGSLAAAAMLAALAPPALAQKAEPLAGAGENIQAVARVKVPRANEMDLAGDWAFVSTDSIDETGGGLAIINIADPPNAYVQAFWDSNKAGLKGQSYGDVDVSTDANTVYLTNAHGTREEGVSPWVVAIDVSDKSHPKLIGKIVDDATMDYVHTATLDGETIYTNPQRLATGRPNGNGHILAWDITDPRNPVKKGEIRSPTGDSALAHDQYIDHRPDGTSLMYSASVHAHDIFKMDGPYAATLLQTSPFYSGTVSHDIQPNHDRSILVVDDENLSGQADEKTAGACAKVGSGAASRDLGSVQFFAAAKDGTFQNAATPLGTFQGPPVIGKGYCVAHVFWQAPDENRLTQAYYNAGAWIVDFKDPANAKSLGSFLPEGGATYWAYKPHNGYIYASNMQGTVDITRYTGAGWPGNAGPAEVQRAKRQGVPYVPIRTAASPPAKPATVASRALGRFAVTAKLGRVPGKAGKKATLVVRFRKAKKLVGTLNVTRRAGARSSVKLSGVAETGTYSYVVKLGRKRLASGRFTVAKGSSKLTLSPSAKLAARAR